MFVKVHDKDDKKEVYLNFNTVVSIVEHPEGGSIIAMRPNIAFGVEETPAELAMAANNEKIRL